jgi:predicted glycoside hydrolase/deacetylase ChbG (UPF0249 family)
MPARLILNADDFGLTPGINRAIAELHSAGALSGGRALTSATLMANGAAFDDAVAVAHAHPTLGVGCHIVLTDGIPVSPPETIPSLLGPDGRCFRPTLTGFLRALFLGRIREQDITREASAQIEKLQRAGIQVTHIDSHKHTHLFPAIVRPLLRVAEARGVCAIRNPFEPVWSLALNQGRPGRRIAIKLVGRLRPNFEASLQLHQGHIITTDGTMAISATGILAAGTLGQILQALPSDGTYELCCHPGYNDADLDRVVTRLRVQRNLEREALLNEVPALLRAANPPKLIHFGDLGKSG